MWTRVISVKDHVLMCWTVCVWREENDSGCDKDWENSPISSPSLHQGQGQNPIWNQRPLDFESNALPTELFRLCSSILFCFWCRLFTKSTFGQVTSVWHHQKSVIGSLSWLMQIMTVSIYMYLHVSTSYQTGDNYFIQWIFYNPVCILQWAAWI